MRKDQTTDEIAGVIQLIDEVYSKFGFEYFLELSTCPEHSMGSDEACAMAEAGLKSALGQLALSYEINEEG